VSIREYETLTEVARKEDYKAHPGFFMELINLDPWPLRMFDRESVGINVSGLDRKGDY
jgi:hypothetical protein